VWKPPSTHTTREVLVSHANAPFTVEGRHRLCLRVDAGRPIAHVAAEAGISRQCLSKWHARWRAEADNGLIDRSSRPAGSPTLTSPEVTGRIEQLRRDRLFGPARIAHQLAVDPDAPVKIAASTVHRILQRLGISRLRDLDRPTGLDARVFARRAANAREPVRPTSYVRYERDAPGDLVHTDVKKLGKIREGGGWWAHGRDSAQSAASRNAPRVGYDYLHVCVDDHSRLAYAEVLPDETGATCAAFISRAGQFMARYGISIVRVMSDNAFAYKHSTAYADAVAALSDGARRKFIKPRCPWQNGKAERFNQTANNEWARAQVFTSSADRAAALDTWLHEYNHHRPHASLDGLPPVSRVTNVPGCDS
jgi:transposase InsO family protein